MNKQELIVSIEKILAFLKLTNKDVIVVAQSAAVLSDFMDKADGVSFIVSKPTFRCLTEIFPLVTVDTEGVKILIAIDKVQVSIGASINFASRKSSACVSGGYLCEGPVSTFWRLTSLPKSGNSRRGLKALEEHINKSVTHRDHCKVN